MRLSQSGKPSGQIRERRRRRQREGDGAAVKLGSHPILLRALV